MRGVEDHIRPRPRPSRERLSPEEIVYGDHNEHYYNYDVNDWYHYGGCDYIDQEDWVVYFGFHHDDEVQQFDMDENEASRPLTPQPVATSSEPVATLGEANLLQLGSKEADAIFLRRLPDGAHFMQWWRDMVELVASCSKDPPAAFTYMCAIEKAERPEDLRPDPQFRTLEAEFLAAFGKILEGDLRHKIQVLKEQQAQKTKMMDGRVLAWHIKQYYQTSAVQGQLMEVDDLLRLQLQNDDLETFIWKWDMCLHGQSKKQDDEVLRTLFHKQMRTSKQLELTMSYCEMSRVQDLDKLDTYELLREIVEKYLANKRREQVLNQRKNGRNDWGAHAYAGKGGHAAKGHQGSCYHLLAKNGRCPRGGSCQFYHDHQTLTRMRQEKGKGKGDGKGEGKRKGKGKGKGYGKDPRKGKGKGYGKESQDNGKGQKCKGQGYKGKDYKPYSTSPWRGRANSVPVYSKNWQSNWKGKGKAKGTEYRGTSPLGQQNRNKCIVWQTGSCQKGDSCNYWHNPDCKSFPKGQCPYGKNCKWRHLPTEFDSKDAGATPSSRSHPIDKCGEEALLDFLGRFLSPRIK